MRAILCVLAMAMAGVAAGPPVHAIEPDWNRDLSAAMAKAKSLNRPLFILFTGHGWCHACDLLDREVLRTEKFVETTKDKYVFVELDLKVEGGPEEDQKTDLMRLQDQYLVLGVPTAVLTDAEGRPYAYLTGYDADTGTDAYLDDLARTARAKSERDAHLQSAAITSGATRAEHLDLALDAISPLLDELEERGDDPLLRFYDREVAEIVQLASGTGPLASKYNARKQTRDAWLKSQTVLKRLDEFEAKQDYAGAIAYIERCLPDATTDAVRWRLEFARQVYFEWSDRNAEAFENVQRLLATDNFTAEQRDSLLDREAYNLFQLERVREGVEHFNRRIAEASEDYSKRIRLRKWKAQMLLDRDPVSDSIAAFEEYRKDSRRGTDDWFRATWLLARELRRGNDHSGTLKVLEEGLEVSRLSWLLVDAAESQLALGKLDSCLQSIEEAEKINRKLQNSERQSDRKEFEAGRSRIDDLKQRLMAAQQQPPTKISPKEGEPSASDSNVP
ncbi:MAG: thioredoxin family protein [Pirellula sp.]